MKPVILFDLDGTLLDSLSDIAQCGNRALALSGLPAHTQEEIGRASCRERVSRCV